MANFHPEPASLVLPTRQAGHRSERGIALVEVMMAVAMLGFLSAATFWGFSQINTYSVSTRLYTTAQGVAQQAIDEILTKGPFDPERNLVPSELALGTHAPETAFIYRDPDTGEAIVTGQLIRTVSDSPTTMLDSQGNTVSMKIRRATVDVTYRFRSRDYTVSMCTLRAADQ